MKKLILLFAILSTTLNVLAQTDVFPQASNKVWKVSVNTSPLIPDSIQVVGADTVIYQYLTGGEVRSGRMSIVTNLLEITDTLTGSISIEACNDNTGLSWARIDDIGKTNDTLIFTNSSLVKKNWDIDANYLKYRVTIRITGDTRFVARTNSAWKRYYYNGNLNN